MRLRWAGFRRVRGQVRKRLSRRLNELGVADPEAYRNFLERHPEEWRHLDSLCRITISRFRRDRGMFIRLRDNVLPELARAAETGSRRIRCWSVGAASGEEPYSLALLWRLDVAAAFPEIGMEILATDADPHMIARARTRRYPRGALRDVPAHWIAQAFVDDADGVRLRPAFSADVRLLCHDIRTAPPDFTGDLILCRNLVFTYFEEALQCEVLEGISQRLRPGGFLVIGKHEQLPADAAGYAAVDAPAGIFRRIA
jgi:chemotaxis protein methyltransferase CheR